MPTFVNRDYGERKIPAEAEPIDLSDEDDVTVWAWQEDEGTFHVQQGYDLILLSYDAVRALAKRIGA